MRRGQATLASAASVGLFIGIALAMFLPALAGGRFFAIDFHLTFEPLRRTLGIALFDGIPLWNPWLGNGTPLLANPMQAAVYPLNLLFLILEPAAGLTWLAILHVVLGAVGAFQLARELGSSRSGATVAGLIFGFNGAAISAISYCNLSWTAAWLPWVLLATGRLLQRGPSAMRIAAVAASLAMMLTLGDPFVIGATVLGVVLFTVESTLHATHGERPRRVGGLALGLGTGLVVAGPFLWGVLRYLPVSVRAAGFTSEGTVLWSMHPLLLVNLYLPNAFGDAGSWGVDRFWATAIFPERGAPLLIGFYVGASGLALALAGAWSSNRRRWVLLLWLTGLLALALGRFGPIYPLFTESSWLQALRYPMKWAVPAMLPLALLAARAFDERSDWSSARMQPLIASTVLVLGLVGAAAVAAGPPFNGWISRVTPPQVAERLGDFRSHFLASGLRACLPLAASLIALVALRGIGIRKLAWVLVAVLGTDLLWANRGLAPMVMESLYAVPPPAVESIRTDGSYQRIFVDSVPGDLRRLEAVRKHSELARWQRELLEGYVAVDYGLPLALNDDTEGFGPHRYAALGVLVRSAPIRERLMMLGSAGASHMVTFEELNTPNAELLAVHRGATDRPQRVYRNRLVLPRARVVGSLLAYDGDEGYVAAIQAGPDDLFARVALVEASELSRYGIDSLASRSPERQAPAAGSAQIVEDRGDRLRISTHGDGGFLIVNDTLVPGWTAALDGRAAHLMLADYAFRAVAIPPGEHEVDMTYRPW